MDKLERIFHEVSDPHHPKYSQYLTAAELEKLLECPNHKETTEKIRNWLISHEVDSEQIDIHHSHILVKAPVKVIEELFQTSLYLHEHSIHGKKIIRARGVLSVPEEIRHSFSFVTGLTEYMHSFQSASYGFAKDLPMEIYPVFSNYSDPFITPKALRELYSIRSDLTGGLTDKNSFGIGAFDDWYYADDLCAAHELLCDKPLSVTPDVTYIGPLYGAENGESDLDTQYSSLMAPNTSSVFYNHQSGTWMLGWAQEVIKYTGDSGPWIWSVSYGWPEQAQCDDALNLTLCSTVGNDWKLYINRTDTEFMKLGTMGVTVIVSSGDDGSAGFGITCPPDPPRSKICYASFENSDDCKCAALTFEYAINATSADETYLCFLPLALNWGSDPLIPGSLGADCDFLFAESNISSALQNALQDAVSQYTNISSDGVKCESYFDNDLNFVSSCSCDQLPVISVNHPSDGDTPGFFTRLSGYQFSSEYGPSIFTPDYPAASAYVVSVGATQMKPSFGSCPVKEQWGAREIGKNEVICNQQLDAFDAGGGFSVTSPQPSWQKDAVDDYLNRSYLYPSKELFTYMNRGYPDLAFNGNRYVVVLNSSVSTIGGTSASAPAFAGSLALMNEVLLASGKKSLGFINPLLYSMAKDGVGFNKIRPTNISVPQWAQDLLELPPKFIVESNQCSRFGCCEFGFKGSDGLWDPVTGLGTPNFHEIEGYLRKLNKLPALGDDNGSSSTQLKLGFVVAISAGALLIGVFIGFAIAILGKRNDHGEYRSI